MIGRRPQLVVLTGAAIALTTLIWVWHIDNTLSRAVYLAWAGLGIWSLVAVYVVWPFFEASIRKHIGTLPFINGILLLAVGNIIENLIYLWILKHPRAHHGFSGELAKHAVDLILTFVILRGLAVLLIGYWVRQRRVHEL